jgi:hypothetical protein
MHKFTVQIVLIAALLMCVTHSKAVGSTIADVDPAIASSQARIVGWISDNLIGPIYDVILKQQSQMVLSEILTL